MTTGNNAPFQPNFDSATNGGNPYAGMPASYAAQVAAVYKPTTTNILNPVQVAAQQGQVGANYKPTPAQVAAQTAAAVTPAAATAAVIAANPPGSKPPAAAPSAPPPTGPSPSKGTVTAAKTASGTPPPPAHGAGSGGFKPTGNVPTDLAALKANGADAFTVAAYMAQYGTSWDYDTPNASNNYINALGVNPVGKPYYNLSSNGSAAIAASVYDKATPQQQFNLLKTVGQLPHDAQLVVNKDGTWGYSSASSAPEPIGGAATINGIPSDLYQEYLQNASLYAAKGKSPPIHYNDLISGQVTVTPYANPSAAVTFAEPAGTYIVFKNVSGKPVINKIINPQTNVTIVQANPDGSFNTADVYNAVQNNQMTQKAAVVYIGQTAYDNAAKCAATMAILNKSYAAGNGNYYISKALAEGAVTQAQLTAAGFTLSEVNTTPPKSSVVIGGGTPAPGEITWTDFKQNPANNIPGSATFDHYDAATGQVYYNVPTAAPANVLAEINSTLTGKKTMSGQVSALNDAIENAGYWDNSLLGKTVYLGGQTFYVDAKGKILTQQDQVKIEWNNLSSDQQAKVAGSYSQDLYRTNPFAETTKQIAVSAQQGGVIGQMVASPLLGVAVPVAKAVTGQKVSAAEIAGGVATVVGDLFMLGGGEALSSLGNAGKIITNSLVTGMGAVGVANTVLQAKQGDTSKGTLAVEAALSVYMLVSGAGGLVSAVVPKDTPNVDTAQQFINKMATQTTPEGLAKNSPFQAPAGDLTEGLPSGTQGVSEMNPSGNLKNWTPTAKINALDMPSYSELVGADPEMATQQANVTANYKDWAQASVDYAQNYKNMLELQSRIADNNTTLDAITKGTTLPDEYTAKLASDTASMQKTLAKLQAAEDGLVKTLSNAESQFNTSMKGYADYLKSNDIYNGSEISEALKTLPRDSAGAIKMTIDQLVNGDNNPAAIAAQQLKVDGILSELNAAKENVHSIAGTEKLSAIESELTQAQAKLALMKVGNLTTAQSQLIYAREALSDVNEIIENGNIKGTAAKQNLLTIKNTLENQISDLEDTLKTQVIQGKGMSDITKIEYIKDASGDTVGARIYSDEGVARYDVDEDGNIEWDSKTDESTGGGKTTAPTKAPEASPDTSTQEETELQQNSRGMPGRGTAATVVMPVIATPRIGKTQEVSQPSVKPQTVTIKTTPMPVTNPGQAPAKTTEVAPITTAHPAINPATTPQSQQSKKLQPQVQQAHALQQATQQGIQQNTQQNQKQQPILQQGMSQQLQKANMISTQIYTPVKTEIKPPPENPDSNIIPPLPGKKQSGKEFTPTAEQIKNATVFKAGVMWWLGFGNGQWKAYRKLPPGAKAVAPGKHSGYNSVQTIQGPPIKDVKRLGIVSVAINRPTKQPGAAGAIAYSAINANKAKSGNGRPGMSVVHEGKMIRIKNVGLARRIPHGRVLRN